MKLNVDTMVSEILELAVRGKLVPQDKNDEPASQVLQRIKAEREQRVADGKMKRRAELPPVAKDEELFDIPEGWTWARLGDLARNEDHSFTRGVACSFFGEDSFVSDGSSIINSANIRDGFWRNAFWRDVNAGCVSAEVSDRHLRVNCQPGDVLISKISTSPGTACLVPGDRTRYIATNNGFKFRPQEEIGGRYLVYALNSPCLKKDIKAKGSGTTLKNLSLAKLQSQLIPLPPLNEQKAIARKIEEMFEILWELSSAADLQTEGMKEMRQNILELAVRGKLVPQDKNDEPASQVLQRIKAEREQRVSDGKMKRRAELPPVAKDEELFDIPEGWTWARLGDLARNEDHSFTSGLRMHAFSEDSFVSDGVLIVDSANIRDDFWGKVFWRDVDARCVSAETFDRCLRVNCQPGDVLISLIFPSPGTACLLPKVRTKYIAANSSIKFRPQEEIDGQYLTYALNSPCLRKDVGAKAAGTAMKVVSIERLQSQLIPLPPLNEQKAIARKIEEIFNTMWDLSLIHI